MQNKELPPLPFPSPLSTCIEKRKRGFPCMKPLHRWVLLMVLLVKLPRCGLTLFAQNTPVRENFSKNFFALRHPIGTPPPSPPIHVPNYGFGFCWCFLLQDGSRHSYFLICLIEFYAFDRNSLFYCHRIFRFHQFFHGLEEINNIA